MYLRCLCVVCPRKNIIHSLYRPVRVEKLTPRLVDPFAGMGIEIVALGLEKVCGKPCTPAPVVEAQGGGVREGVFPYPLPLQRPVAKKIEPSQLSL